MTEPADGGASGGVRARLALAATLLVVLLGLAWTAKATLTRSAVALAYPYQLDPEEGFLLEQALQLTRGQTIYPSLADYPFTVGNYPPIYPALYAGLVSVLGPSLPAGRLLGLLATLAILAALIAVTMRETSSALAGLLASGLFVATWPLAEWLAFARVDLLALAFGLAGFAVMTGRWSRLRLALGVALFTAAFFTKQTQLFAPAAVFAGLLMQRQWRRAALFAGALSGACAGIGIALNLATGGEFFRHTVTYNANVMYWNQVGVWLRHLWMFAGFALLALAPAAWVLLAGREEGQPVEPDAVRIGGPVAVYLGLAALSLVTTAKAGAASNYLLEFHAVLGLALGLAAGRADRIVAHPSWKCRVPVAALLVLLVLHAADLNVGVGTPAKRLFFPPPPSPGAHNQRAYIELRLLEYEGPKLCDEPIFLIRSGQPVLYQPFIMTQLAREGKWDAAPLLRDIEAAHFGAIMTKQNLEQPGAHLPGFTEAMRAAILKAYTLEDQIGEYRLYVPREKARPAEPPRMA
ncbi:MAG: DUF2029 domain-containing protein [Candidatus Sumerlaeia bacterium]|nr:DUF2029 domain-containing protein [Candidatus Sumerlaeia bacterium]